MNYQLSNFFSKNMDIHPPFNITTLLMLLFVHLPTDQGMQKVQTEAKSKPKITSKPTKVGNNWPPPPLDGQIASPSIQDPS